MGYKSELEKTMEELNYCNRMISLSSCVYAKQYFINLASYKIEQTSNQLSDPYRQTVKQFTIQELAKYDGSMGKPAYVAVNGTVYDVSWNGTWSGGTHFGVYAGKDLSEEFKKNHGSEVEILKKLPVVGVLK